MSPKITVKVMKDGNESFEVSFDVSKDTVCAGRENNNDIVIKSADWIDEKQFSVFKKSEENDIYYIKNTSNNHSMYTVGAEPEIVRGEYQLYSKSQNTFRIFNPENEEYYVEIIIEIWDKEGEILKDILSRNLRKYIFAKCNNPTTNDIKSWKKYKIKLIYKNNNNRIYYYLFL